MPSSAPERPLDPAVNRAVLLALNTALRRPEHRPTTVLTAGGPVLLTVLEIHPAGPSPVVTGKTPPSWVRHSVAPKVNFVVPDETYVVLDLRSIIAVAGHSPVTDSSPRADQGHAALL